MPLRPDDPKRKLRPSGRKTNRCKTMHKMQPRHPQIHQPRRGASMKNMDEMYPWELEEHLDIRCIRLDSELEERETLNCHNCGNEKGSLECENCYVGGY